MWNFVNFNGAAMHLSIDTKWFNETHSPTHPFFLRYVEQHKQNMLRKKLFRAYLDAKKTALDIMYIMHHVIPYSLSSNRLISFEKYFN